MTVQVEDKPTGSISLSGGYSTTEGALAEVAFTETNFLGRGQYVKISASEGQYSNGWGLTFTEPYFLDQHLAAGFDIFHKEQDVNPVRGIRDLDDGREPAPRRSDHRRVHVPAELFDLPVADHDPEHGRRSRMTIADRRSTAPGGSTVWNDTGHRPADGDRRRHNCLTNGEASVAIKEAGGAGRDH